MPINYRRLGFPLFSLLLVAGIVTVLWWKPWWKADQPTAEVDMEDIAKLNNRGIGLMEQLTRYDEAAVVFQEVADKAPNWRPGKINLAIALLNSAEKANMDRAVAILNEILAADPNDPHAHYCLGIIHFYRGEVTEAAPHFEAVTKIDPKDAHAWYHLGRTQPNPRVSPEARECFRRALELNPYLNAARYEFALHADQDEKTRDTLLAERKALTEANWDDAYQLTYKEMGKYGDVIGRTGDTPRPKGGPLPMFSGDPALKVELPAGARWANRADLKKDVIGRASAAVRDRVGGAMTLLDFDRDGKPDVFLPMAVIENGHIRHLLLHNEGGRFRDVTKEHGLGGRLGCSTVCVGDFDNDGFPDLFLGGTGELALFRNLGGKSFADVTKAAGLDKLTGACQSCLWADIDQDGDLDLALAFAFDNFVGIENGLVVMLNAGEAPPMAPGAKDAPPLTTRFKRCETLPKEVTGVPVTHVLAADLDGDRDVDLLVSAEDRPRPVYNDRLLRFHVGPPGPAGKGGFTGLAMNTQPNDRSDLLMFDTNGPPVLLTGDNSETAPRFAAETLAAPRLLQMSAFDIDLDGATDAVGLSAREADKPARPTLLHNEGGNLTARGDAFGPEDVFPLDLIAAVPVDIDGDCQPDFLYWSEGSGLGWRRNLGNGNMAVRVDLTGKRDKGAALRTNADGIGGRVWALAGQITASVEHVTLSSGPGQSLLPLTLGIGPAKAAEVVRVRWPDGVPQAEFDIPTCEVKRLTEHNRKGVSCPILLTWDGEKFAYVTDCLGAGSVGEMTADGSVRSPRPEESIRIDGRLLKPKDGHFAVKLAEPMDEVMYLDRARLTAIDHPADWKVIPDERFATADPPPTQELLAFRKWLLPTTARDHRGTDVTAKLRDRDGKTTNEFARRSWIGFAEDHHVEFEFGERDFKPGERWFLVLHGWTDYPYPESIFAADQAGVKMQFPLLERTNEKGEWETVGEIGFPAGLPKTMTAEVTGKLGGRFRIRTNLQIYWDQIALARLEATLPAENVCHLKLTDARLAHRGFMREVSSTNPTDPVSYDDSKTEKVAVTKWKGRLTRTGDVTELLETTDDQQVICGPGDEVTIRFADDLPKLPVGWERTFVLRTWGYCKDPSPFTGTGGFVYPLPFRTMPRYPYGEDLKLPATLLEYDRKWNTREMTGGW